MSDTVKRMGMSRRSFLANGAWLAAGVTVMLTSCSSVRSALPALPTFDSPETDDALAWIQVLPGGRIRFFCPRMEMGQGVSLGLSQVVAEELNVDRTDIECILPDTGQTPPFKMTVGSEGIANFFEPVSYGAARLREALRALAAKKSGLSPDQVRDGRGGFVLPSGSSLSYGELVPAEPLILSPSDSSTVEAALPRYALQRRGAYKAIGHSWKHQDLEAIVTGKTVYSRDVTVPGMLYGQVVRPPAFGAWLKNADGRAAEAMPGVIAVVIDKETNFVGVVTNNPFVLPAAMQEIETHWDMPDDLNQDHLEARLDVEKHRVHDNFEHTLSSAGDIGTGRARAVHQTTARYDTSFATHAQMEPRASVAWVKKDKVEVWCGSQDPFFVQRRIAKAVGRNVEDVLVHSHRLGGGFGGRTQCIASEEAAVLSAAVSKPVRVQWDRNAEFQNNYCQPVFSHFIDAGVNNEGEISHWEHDFISSPIMTGMIGGLVPGIVTWAVDQVVTDKGTARGALSPYHLSNHRVRFSDIRTAVPTGAWRGLGTAPNNFAIESMIDELAVAAGIDPLDLRLLNLPPESQRLANVLRKVAEMAKWGQPVQPDTGMGIACAVYKGLTAVAVVAEVQMDHAARELRVTKTWCAQDCGLVVNPDQVENQIMGNIVWGCSMALKERLTVKAGSIEQRNFDTYNILRHHEAPEIIVELMDSSEAPVGVGESAFGPVAPAIANAIFSATGRRIRRLPISYGSVFPDAKS